MKIRFLVFLSMAMLLGILPPSASPSGEQKKAAVEPQYNGQGQLKRPTDYKTWVFVGANLGLQYRREGEEKKAPDKQPAKAGRQTFHNVYINPEAYQTYVKTGKFPDKTVLVMEVYEALEREPQGIVTQGFFPGKLLAVEAAVKNKNRPDGSKTDWAYYAFSAKQQTAKAFPDANCYACHRKHADDDNVWVQFYPTLRPHRKTPGK